MCAFHFESYYDSGDEFGRADDEDYFNKNAKFWTHFFDNNKPQDVMDLTKFNRQYHTNYFVFKSKDVPKGSKIGLATHAQHTHHNNLTAGSAGGPQITLDQCRYRNGEMCRSFRNFVERAHNSWEGKKKYNNFN